MHHILGGAARHLALALGLRASTLAKSLPEQPAEQVCAALLKAPFLTGGLQVYYIIDSFLTWIIFLYEILHLFKLFIRYCNLLTRLKKKKEKLVVRGVQQEVLHVHQYRPPRQFQQRFFQEYLPMLHLTYL